MPIKISFDIQMVVGYTLDVNCNPKILDRGGVAMRKSKQAAAETRKRIVTAAACEFREKGIVATGLADLMKAAGLTHGGFYKHFASKDQLVAEAAGEAVNAVIGEMAAHPTINSAVAAYLSTRHRDNPASGCPLAAIGSELSRPTRRRARQRRRAS